MRFFLFFIWCIPAFIDAQKPRLCFTDLTSGPSSGNSDVSLPGQVKNKDGAIVTLWGHHLGSQKGLSEVYVNGAKARIYTWGTAKTPADLYKTLKLYKVEFQIPAAVSNGPASIQIVLANGDSSNTLPFTVRPGNIYFVKKSGHDVTGDGSWQKPWATLDNASYTGALEKIKPGDIVYLGHGVEHKTLVGDRAAIDFSAPGTKDLPKAIVGYPKAKASIGDSTIARSYSLWVSGIGPSYNWVVSKLHLTGAHEAATMYHGFRLVGNKITAPKGDGPTGAIAALGNDLYILGNELTQIGFTGTSKLYHPIYIQSAEACSGARLPIERNREVAWNYMHDNLAFDGINIYRECGSSAYMTDHRVHDNYILNQTGCGIRIGDYVTGENWFYNNVVIQAGLGPDPATEQAMHVPVLIHAGWNDTSTLIHFYNNTIYGGGYTGGADWASSMVGFAYNHPFDLDWRNNIIVSNVQGVSYLNSRLEAPKSGVQNNIWFGAGAAPLWDQKSLSMDPLFKNPVKLNFNLMATSKAIDASFPLIKDSKLPVPDYDIEGRRRTNPDLGAYEYVLPPNTLAPRSMEVVHSLKIFPNPAIDKLWITGSIPLLARDTTKIHIHWYDITGKLLASEIKPQQEVIELNVPDLTSGVYLMEVNGVMNKVVVR